MTGSSLAQVSVRSFRDLIRQRHRDEKLIDVSSIDHSELVFNLTRLMNRLGQDFETLHRPHGWTWAGFRIMNLLWAVGATEAREVARLSGASRATIWSALKTLERDGMVTRTRGELDRRMMMIELTTAGRDAIEDGIRRQAALEEEWFGALTPADQRELRRLLELLADQRREARKPDVAVGETSHDKASQAAEPPSTASSAPEM